jgi:hypothetical protein
MIIEDAYVQHLDFDMLGNGHRFRLLQFWQSHWSKGHLLHELPSWIAQSNEVVCHLSALQTPFKLVNQSTTKHSTFNVLKTEPRNKRSFSIKTLWQLYIFWKGSTLVGCQIATQFDSFGTNKQAHSCMNYYASYAWSMIDWAYISVKNAHS